jgi:hypothetical protein
MRSIYATHSFLRRGIDFYKGQLADGSYVSFGAFDDGILVAHAGYSLAFDFAVMNCLAVDRSYRHSGLGRRIFNERLAHMQSGSELQFVVGYSKTQHLGSQKLYPDAFKPIGLNIGYPDIYHQGDACLNRGHSANAEIVLCLRLAKNVDARNLSLPSAAQRRAGEILNSLDVPHIFDDGPHRSQYADVFLGFHPSVSDGLFVPAFLQRTSRVDFAPLLTSNEERRLFVAKMQKDYEA